MSEARVVRRPDLGRVWLHVLLLLVTILATTIAGARMQFNFVHDLPVFDVDRDAGAFFSFWRHPGLLVGGLPFSLTLVTILLAHEFGHYLACVYYGVDATLPFFIPFPSLIGTMGAFIRIKSPIYSKRILFDIGIAGPLAGFVFLLPALSVGLAFSKIVPGINHQGSLNFGLPPILWLLEKVIFPGVSSADIYLHPVARAGWVGAFATFLNLLPVGQLDGGHVLYALFGEKYQWISRAFIALLIPAGYFWDGWLMWAVLLFIFARRHPSIYDLAPPGAVRIRLGIVALAMFLLSFMLAPIGSSMFGDLIRWLIGRG
ncbi:MAG TPA: site-2 protease family protein [Bryobacteraceae bacterium]